MAHMTIIGQFDGPEIWGSELPDSSYSKLP